MYIVTIREKGKDKPLLERECDCVIGAFGSAGEAHCLTGIQGKRQTLISTCLAMIDSADLVAFLPGWESSAGARIEHEYCRYTGKRMKMLGETGDDN